MIPLDRMHRRDAPERPATIAQAPGAVVRSARTMPTSPRVVASELEQRPGAMR